MGFFENLKVAAHEMFTLCYEDGVNELGQVGGWAYIKEIPTTRTWGVSEREAIVNLMCLVMGVENQDAQL